MKNDLSGFWVAALVRGVLFVGVPLALVIVLFAPATSPLRPYLPLSFVPLAVLVVYVIFSTLSRYRHRVSELASSGPERQHTTVSLRR